MPLQLMQTHRIGLKKTDLKELQICKSVFVASSEDESWAVLVGAACG